MELIADGLLIATAMAAGLYCMVLSRRLRRLTEAGDGIGPRIEDLNKALAQAGAALAETRAGVEQLRSSARSASVDLAREITRGEGVAAEIAKGVDAGQATLQRLYEADKLFNGPGDEDSTQANPGHKGQRVELPDRGAEQVSAADDPPPEGKSKRPRRKSAKDKQVAL